MKTAIIGSGISGLTAAYLLNRNHDITVYEANDYIGGHTHTVEVELQGKSYFVDTGFIVCNDRTYPNFLKLLDQLNVAKVATEMGFGIRSDRTGIEYSTTGLNSLFAQRKNFVNLNYWKMLKSIIRFNRDLTSALHSNTLDEQQTLGNYLKQHHYNQYFIDHFIIPMGAAIWSIGLEQMMDFPLQAFARFFHNHGLLTVNDQPQWYFIKGGSHSYVKKMINSFEHKIKLSTPVESVIREEGRVTVKAGAETEDFEKVVFATHSDITLNLLAEPTLKEKEILGDINYQPNDIILHHDLSVLPRSRRAWAAWNYHLQESEYKIATLTYNMSLLQKILSPETLCVTLNGSGKINPAKILGRYQKDHPVFDKRAITAQQRYEEIGGKHNTYFCGAYWFNGFHEDGVNSALRVTRDFGEDL